MCYVIVTSRTLLWTLLTVVSTMAMLAAVVSPQWIVGAPRRATFSVPTYSVGGAGGDDHGVDHDYEQLPVKIMEKERTFAPTLGIFNRCTRIHHTQESQFHYNCASFVTGFQMPSDRFPDAWKASLIFFSLGLVFMGFTMLTSIIGCCIRAIVKKSIFTISGTVQAIAGLFYILGIVCYPGGWGSRRVQNLCGEDARAFLLGDCSVGWAFYLSIGAIMTTFLCSVLSIQAEISTSSDKVQDEISEGKNLICLL